MFESQAYIYIKDKDTKARRTEELQDTNKRNVSFIIDTKQRQTNGKQDNWAARISIWMLQNTNFTKIFQHKVHGETKR